MTTPIPVWTDPAGEVRYAALDFGTFFHRGPGPAIPLKLWNSLGQPTWPAMSTLTLRATGLNALTQQVIDADGLLIYIGGSWQSLASPVALDDLAAHAGIPLWLRLALPDPLLDAIPMGRLRADLIVSWK